MLISYLSLHSDTEKDSTLDINSYGVLYLDKIAHSLAYLLFAIQGFLQLKVKRRYHFVCIAISFYGMFLEWIQQSFIPQRMGSIEDALANVFGVIIGYTLCVYWSNRRNNV